MTFSEMLESRALLSAGMPHAPHVSQHAPSSHVSQPQHHQHKLSKEAVKRLELRYMKDMIDHHHMAIMMAELGMTKATRLEIRELSEGIIKAQTTEIKQMQSWLKSWYGTEHAPEMTKADVKQMKKLESLSGKTFDIAFLKEMIIHHKMAVTMSRPVAEHAIHPELKQLAKNVISKQTAEIRQMQTWLHDWYGVHGGGSGHNHK